MKKTAVVSFLTFLFGAVSVNALTALEQTGFKNISWEPLIQTQVSVICEGKSGQLTMGGNLTTGAKFLPTLYSIKEKVNLQQPNLIPGTTCYEYRYDTSALSPTEYILPEYQNYANSVADYDLLLLNSNGIVGNINTETANYEDLQTLAAELDVVLSNKTYDTNVKQEEVNYLMEEKSVLTDKKNKVDEELRLQNLAETTQAQLTDELNRIQTALEAKILELEDTKRNYVVGDTFSVADTLTEHNLGTGTEYNVAEYLDMYIAAHQSDIRTSKTKDNTIMDLDTMKINFLQTEEVR